MTPAEKEREEIDGDVKISQAGKVLAEEGGRDAEGVLEEQLRDFVYERPRPRTEGGNLEYMRIRNGEVLVKASGPLEWVKAMVAALPGED